MCAHACTDLYDFFLVISTYLMSLSSKFRKDPCFRWGDIQLLVTMYIWYFTLNYSQFLTKNFDFFGTPSWKCFHILWACFLSLKGSVPRKWVNIFKKVFQKNRNFRLKIGYNSGCNIKDTWLLKVEYLLNGRTDLYEN